ncbi:MAG: CsgG/HfaB family protein [Treponema sp.]|nr:CsgG/HfaB family protein [Treponema sp.]
MKKLIIFWAFLGLCFLGSCSSTPNSTPNFEKFVNHEEFYPKFIGNWISNEGAEDGVEGADIVYETFEFRNDGTGFWMLLYAENNNVKNRSVFRYKLSDFQIIFKFIDDDFINMANYYFLDNDTTLSTTKWLKGSNINYYKNSLVRIDGNDIKAAITNSFVELQSVINKESKIAIVNVSSSDTEMSEFVASELEYLFVKTKFIIVDRAQLDLIRSEQHFQLSGEVDDNAIISIGRFAGANIVITGNISGSGSTRRLRLRALNIETAQVIGVASEAF